MIPTLKQFALLKMICICDFAEINFSLLAKNRVTGEHAQRCVNRHFNDLKKLGLAIAKINEEGNKFWSLTIKGRNILKKAQAIYNDAGHAAIAEENAKGAKLEPTYDYYGMTNVQYKKECSKNRYYKIFKEYGYKALLAARRKESKK
jgi:hypothetical protein